MFLLVQAMCNQMSGCENSQTDPDTHLTDLHAALSIFMNFTGSVKCFDFKSDSAPSLGADGWDFQVFTT